MSEKILIEEFHLTMLVPRSLPSTEYDRICRTLDSRRFRAQLMRALRSVIRRHRTLTKIVTEIST